MHYERCNVNQSLFYALQELHYVNKSKVTVSFRGNWYGLYFLALFDFSLLLSIGKRSTLAKILGTGLLFEETISIYSDVKYDVSYIDMNYYIWITYELRSELTVRIFS